MSEYLQDVALRCINIEKSYPVQKELRIWRLFFTNELTGQWIHALRDISMSVPTGKIVGILGHNGAGKSTLLRVLGGVYSPTRGRVEKYGCIAGLFELGGMGNTNLTGREYAIRYLRFMGAHRTEVSALLDDILVFSELGEAFDHRIRTYSSGMAARLYFATVTALQHEIYLIDELLAVGDEHFQAKCWERMRQLLLGGASGVLVTHDWTAILRLCKQAHVIERGRFTFSGDSDKAVVSYLNLPVPNPTVARFSSCNPQTQLIYSEKDATIVIGVEILDHAPVDFGISVEILRIGIGWEIVLLAESIPVGERPGKYSMTVSIPNCPLVPDVYSLNVFLSSRKLHSQDATVAFDVRSWTLGNGYRLQVEGERTKASVNLPYVCRRIGHAA